MSLQIIRHIQQLLKEKDLTTCEKRSKLRTRKNSRCVDLKRNGKQEINWRWKLRNEHVFLKSCFYRCLLFHCIIFLKICWIIFGVGFSISHCGCLIHAEMEWDTVTVSAIFVLYEWFWFLHHAVSQALQTRGAKSAPMFHIEMFLKSLERVGNCVQGNAQDGSRSYTV